MQTKPSTPDSKLSIRSGVFISDLHLFSPRSAAAESRRQLSEYNQREQCIVLGGDIFDFRWSDQGSLTATLDAAQGWLEDLLAATGQAQIQFLPGNHDCHPQLLSRLQRLAEQEPRFGWHEHHVCMGDSLFLHGDILDARGDLTGYRNKFQHTKPQSLLSHRLYDAIVGLRIHKWVPLLLHQPQATRSRLWNLVQASPLVDDLQIRRVFFGHTHVPMHGEEISEIRFFNPGAALRHMRSHLQHFEFDQPVSPCRQIMKGS